MVKEIAEWRLKLTCLLSWPRPIRWRKEEIRFLVSFSAWIWVILFIAQDSFLLGLAWLKYSARVLAFSFFTQESLESRYLAVILGFQVSVQVIQATDDPLKITNPVAIAVLEGLRINLVHNCVIPPMSILHPTLPRILSAWCNRLHRLRHHYTTQNLKLTCSL